MTTLLNDLQGQFGCAYLFITHDLATAFQLSTRIAIMYLGEIVELLPADAFHEGTLHPYSQGPRRGGPRSPTPHSSGTASTSACVGDVPSAASPPSGCRFHTRCPYVQERCKSERPALAEHGPGHWAACHFAGRLPPPRGRRSGGAPSRVGPDMVGYVLAKTAGLVAVLLAVSIVVFFLGRGVAPGDVGTVIIGTDGATPAQIEKVRHELGPRPPPVRRLLQVAGRRRPPAPRLLADQRAQCHVAAGPAAPGVARARLSLVVLTTLMGVPLGVIAAVHANRIWDTTIRVAPPEHLLDPRLPQRHPPPARRGELSRPVLQAAIRPDQLEPRRKSGVHGASRPSRSQCRRRLSPCRSRARP